MPVALVTAAGSGIGAEAARALSKSGYDVAILSSSGRGAALADTLGGVGITGSNQNPDDLERTVDAVMARWGRVDVLVNSAGHGSKGEVTALTDEQWQQGYETYLLPLIRLARLVAPVMAAQSSGSIINISTSSPFEPNPSYPTSAVFRAGLAAYCKLFADEYGQSGVRMNNVLPGFVDSFPVPDELVRTIPLRRPGTPGDVAELICFLAGPNSSYITGQNIRVDGGVTRSV